MPADESTGQQSTNPAEAQIQTIQRNWFKQSKAYTVEELYWK